GGYGSFRRPLAKRHGGQTRQPYQAGHGHEHRQQQTGMYAPHQGFPRVQNEGLTVQTDALQSRDELALNLCIDEYLRILQTGEPSAVAEGGDVQGADPFNVIMRDDRAHYGRANHAADHTCGLQHRRGNSEQGTTEQFLNEDGEIRHEKAQPHPASHQANDQKQSRRTGTDEQQRQARPRQQDETRVQDAFGAPHTRQNTTADDAPHRYTNHQWRDQHADLARRQPEAALKQQPI